MWQLVSVLYESRMFVKATIRKQCQQKQQKIREEKQQGDQESLPVCYTLPFRPRASSLF